MSISYRGKYFRIYIWQGLSIILGFLSLFIVMPSLSGNKTLFGIYSVCTSLTIFFSYADLGFISSGLKYAAEYYIRGDRKNEIRTIGFTAFIMLSMFMLIALLFGIISIFPQILMPELEPDSENFYTARYLLILLSVSCPVIIGQRILNMIYSIRVEDYKLQRISAVGSILKILSVFFFFGSENYLLVPYFAFVQFINLSVVLMAAFQVRKYQYSFVEFLKAIRFDRIIFDKEKGLTGASFISILSWVLFYEFDQIAISNTCAVMANAVLRTGATPIYVDIDKDTLGMSAESLVSKITNRTKVVVAQHSFGIPCKIDKIKEIAKSHSCYLVEDCALTFGSKYKSIIVGNYGDAAIFSTDHTKPLNTLIGGFVYTNDIDIATSIRAMRDDCGDLSNEHQRMILKTYIDEHRIETVNHKIYIMRNYKKALMNKLHIHNEISPYLELETSAKIAINPYYSYPAKLPSVLAKIGLHVLEQYKANIHQRQSWLKEILQVVEKKEDMPAAYYDTGCDIIPLRIAYSTHFALTVFSYIDDWIWFKTPIVATKENICDFGYHWGGCPVAEKIGKSIMNLPVIIDSKQQNIFLRNIKKTYSYGI